MGASKQWYVYCDGEENGSDECEMGGDEATWGDGSRPNLSEYRAELKELGWTFKKGKDFCPSCSKKFASHNGDSVK